jgi:hypothetical protein
MHDLFEDLASLAEFAKRVGKNPRTVRHWMDRGLPYLRLGNQRYIHLPSARTWLMAGLRGASTRSAGRVMSELRSHPLADLAPLRVPPELPGRARAADARANRAVFEASGLSRKRAARYRRTGRRGR